MIPKPILFLLAMAGVIGGGFPRLGMALFAFGMAVWAAWVTWLVARLLFGD